MLKYKDVKTWIREAAAELGAQVSGYEARSLAGDFLTTLDSDPGLRYSVITYNDPTGERAVKAWFRSVSA